MVFRRGGLCPVEIQGGDVAEGTAKQREILGKKCNGGTWLSGQRRVLLTAGVLGSLCASDTLVRLRTGLTGLEGCVPACCVAGCLNIS